MNEQYFQTLKSAETEDWLDFHVIRPFCFQLARFFAKFDINPNTITIWSMFIGAGSAYFFAQGCYHYGGVEGLLYNLFGILDGTAGFVWFIPIYLALVWRFYQHHEIEFGWLGIEDTPENTMIATIVVLILGNISGFLGMGGQTRLADYYIQVHLFFLKGEKGSELDNSVRQQELYDQMPADAPYYERWFQKSYVDYTKKQEKSTPQFQRLLAVLKQKYGSVDNIPAEVREDIHKNSLALMKWNGLLTFNFREAWFFLFCLLDIPVMNFIFEIVCMSLLTWYINHRHESFCRRIADSLK